MPWAWPATPLKSCARTKERFIASMAEPRVSRDGHRRESGHAKARRRIIAKSDKARVLLVEDHADTAYILERLLDRFGYDVQVANNVADALRLAETESFDAVPQRHRPSRRHRLRPDDDAQAARAPPKASP